jgi:ribonuclease R
MGRVRGITTPPRLDAHRLIEEFMIATNVAAAEENLSQSSNLSFSNGHMPESHRKAAHRSFSFRLISVTVHLRSSRT